MARAGSMALAFMMVVAALGDKMWVEDGCSNEGSGSIEHSSRCSSDGSTSGCSHVGAFHDVGEDFNTRCCAKEAMLCLEHKGQHECEDKYPHDGPFDPNAPWHTFAVARQTCASRSNARLCTKKELKANICCGKGGMCDNFKIWTSTKQCPGVTENQCTSLPGCAWEQGECECDPYPPGSDNLAACPDVTPECPVVPHPPENGSPGDCGPTLAVGSTCRPECNHGYHRVGVTSCDVDNGMPTLTPATCEANMRWAIDGCSSEGSGNTEGHDPNGVLVREDTVAGDHPDDIHVRCCKDDKCLETKRKCRNPGHFGGQPEQGLTFADAQQHCASKEEGARLCTKKELKNDLCCGKGGLCDNHQIWTSTKVCTMYYSESDCPTDTDDDCVWADSQCQTKQTSASTNQACATFTTDATCTAASGCEWSKVGDQWTCQNSVYYTQAASAHTCIIASLPLIAFAAQCFV